MAEGLGQDNPMKPTPRPWRRKWILAGCLISPLLCILFGIFLYSDIDIRADPIREQLSTLDAAKSLWAAQHVSHYRMLVEVSTCQHDVEVLNEKVVQTYENTCQQPDVTVSTLFDRIAHEIQQIRWINGVGCDLLAAHPSFDPIWGYPSKIEYRQEWASPANIGGLAYIAARPLGRLDMRACTLLGFSQASVFVKSLVPLP